MARHKHANSAWDIPTLPGGKVASTDAHLCVLMDIRDEMQALRRLAECYRIPRALDALIEMGAAARRKKRKAATARRNKR